MKARDRSTLVRHLRTIAGITTRDKKRHRRDWRRHARVIAATLPERAAQWRKRARNG